MRWVIYIPFFLETQMMKGYSCMVSVRNTSGSTYIYTVIHRQTTLWQPHVQSMFSAFTRKLSTCTVAVQGNLAHMSFQLKKQLGRGPFQHLKMPEGKEQDCPVQPQFKWPNFLLKWCQQPQFGQVTTLIWSLAPRHAFESLGAFRQCSRQAWVRNPLLPGRWLHYCTVRIIRKFPLTFKLNLPFCNLSLIDPTLSSGAAENISVHFHVTALKERWTCNIVYPSFLFPQWNILSSFNLLSWDLFSRPYLYCPLLNWNQFNTIAVSHRKETNSTKNS